MHYILDKYPGFNKKNVALPEGFVVVVCGIFVIVGGQSFVIVDVSSHTMPEDTSGWQYGWQRHNSMDKIYKYYIFAKYI